MQGGGCFRTCPECSTRPAPQIKSHELRQGLRIFLPLPKLKVLRLSVAPNFLDILDLEMYREITDGLQAVEKLWLSHGEFATSCEFTGTTFHERVPLHHLAAFCKMLPRLREVSLGTVDTLALEDEPHEEWRCEQVNALKIGHWAGHANRSGGVSRDQLLESLKGYFPSSDLAKAASVRIPERLYIFDVA